MNHHVTPDLGALIPKPNLARELGVCSRTVSRWVDDPAIDFPRPVVIRGRLYFDRTAVERWKIARLTASIKGESTTRHIGESTKASA
jgi:hypothetical protein